MIIWEGKSVLVEFDSLIPTMIWTCKSEYPISSEFIESFKVGIDFYVNKIKELPSLGWLNDTRKIIGANPKDILWLDKNVNNKAYKAGGKKVAFVLPEEIFGRLAVRTYTFMTLKRSDNTFKIRSFNKIEEAKAWLANS